MREIESWTDTYKKLVRAHEKKTLSPADLEKLGLSAYLTGREEEAFRFMEESHHGYLHIENLRQAVRCTFWLGLMLMNAGERARSSGWIARGERILNEHCQDEDGAEKGLLQIPRALAALQAGDVESARDLFAEAESMGKHFADTDLIVLARLGRGQAFIQRGDVTEGIKLLDEIMVTVETDPVFPMVSGIVYCAVIETCRKVWDIRRAQEWTAALTKWCDARPDVIPFKGQCLVARAEVIQFHGEWPKALEEINEACNLLTNPRTDVAAGEAYYRQAELHRLLGNFDEAENSYHEAAKLGRKPQPGLALLRLAQNRLEEAEISIRNTLHETHDTRRRAEQLPAMVRIMTAAHQIEEATKAVDELLHIAQQLQAPYLQGMSAHAEGGLLLEEGKMQPALLHLQEACKIWNLLHLPYELALTKELKGMVYKRWGDKDNAESEWAAAQWIFEQLGAGPDLERVQRQQNKGKHRENHGLSLRELQVLQLIAAGKTNKVAANELFISERTVDRHVSNIFKKIGVSSRVEATTYALRNNLLNQEV
ncbi:MAG: LuxR C-terminal-related transcriptional regulator [Cyclobacteriaceae bacterium]